MKCPKCGNEIESGHLICEVCGAEITIVPEYEAQVEERIGETMSQITDAIDRQDKQEELARAAEKEAEEKKIIRDRIRRGRLILLIGMFCGIGIVLVAVSILQYRWRQSSAYNIGRAYTLSAAGQYDEAAEAMKRAVLAEPSDDLTLLLAGFQQSAGDLAGARESAMSVIRSENAADDDVVRAYGRIVSLATAEGSPDELAPLLESCGRADVQKAYEDYMTQTPQPDMAPGTYEDELTVTVTYRSGDEVLCELESRRIPEEGKEAADQPAETRSWTYDGPITLTPGRHTLRVSARNRFGAVSDEIVREYEVTRSLPDRPVILTASGSYGKRENIEAELPESGTLRYTDDGSDPDVTSQEYTSPIPMPYGASVFRFAVFSEDGVRSEIAEAHYDVPQPVSTPSIGAAEGPNWIIASLIRTGEIADTAGTIRDGSAVYAYGYMMQRDIPERGSFFVYAEILADPAGNSVQTGRRFAVNSASGTVYLYEESEDGSPVLTPWG